VIPSNQPIRVLARMIHTSEAFVDPNAQLSFTPRVLTEMRTTRMTSRTTNATVRPYRRARWTWRPNRSDRGSTGGAGAGASFDCGDGSGG